MRQFRSSLVVFGFVLAFVEVVLADDDSEVALNLFTDFTPLLALFGEQFARQFMSESLSWLDHIIFAMVPLGIVTAIIGAIRVCGPKWARAVIGRARETRAVAEIELMSSTSQEVCEVFNGKSIVRAMGEPQLKQFLLFPHLYDKSNDVDCGLYTLQKAFEADKIRSEKYRGPMWRLISRITGWITRSPYSGEELKFATQPTNTSIHSENIWEIFIHILARIRRRPSSGSGEITSDIEAPKLNISNGRSASVKVSPIQNDNTRSHRPTERTERTDSSASKATRNVKVLPQVLVRSAPNLQLNQYSDKPSINHNDGWLFGAAATGIILQVGVLVIAGITVYHGPTKAAIGQKNDVYGFPFFLSGTVVLVFGMLLCSWVIERSTEEIFWKTNIDRDESCTDPTTRSTQNIKSSISTSSPGEGRNSKEDDLTKNQNLKFPHLIWLQRKHVVNDQAFDPFVILGGAKKGILTSCRAPDGEDETNVSKAEVNVGENTSRSRKDLPRVKLLFEDVTGFITMLGALCGMVGFVLQFQGLRGLSWPSSVAQLLAIFFMAVTRAAVRRTLGWTPPFCRTLAECELDWLAIRIVFCKSFREGSRESVQNCLEKDCTKLHASHVYRFEILTSTVSQDQENNPIHEFLMKAGTRLRSGEIKAAGKTIPSSQRTLQVRQRISELTAWQGRASKAAMSVKRAIELFMNEFFTEPLEGLDVFTWSLDTKIEHRSHIEGDWKEPDDIGSNVIRFTIERKGGKWSSQYSEIDSALSLWMSLFERKWHENHGKLDDEKPDDDGPSTHEWVSDAEPQWETREYRYRRILGTGSEVLKRDLAWWVDDMLGYEETRDLPVAVTIGFHGLREDEVSPPPKAIKELSIISRRPLPTILAQHLFTGFVWSISKYLPHDALSSADIEDRDRFIPHRIAETYWFPTLRNRKLMKIIRISESLGLGTVKDILLCLIPPLSTQLLLPNEEILDLVLQSANELEKGHNWTQAAEIYDAWLETVISKQREERYNYAVVVAVIDFLLQATEPFKWNTTEGVMHKGAPVVRGIVERIVRKLHSKNLLSLAWSLQLFYKKQGREDDFRNLIPKDLQKELSRDKTIIPLESKENWRRLGFSEAHTLACSDAYDALRGVDETQADIFGWTPLHYYAAQAKDDEIDDEDIINLHHKADKTGRTPCHYAAISGSEKLLRGFLGEQPDQATEAAIKGRDGMTLLHLAAKFGRLELVKQLAKPRERLHVTDNWGRTAIHIAANEGHREVVDLLMKEAGDEWKDPPCYSELSSRSALHLAVLNGHEKVVQSMIEQTGIVALGVVDSDMLNSFELALLNGGKEVMMDTLVETFHKYYRRDESGDPDNHRDETNTTSDGNMGNIDSKDRRLDVSELKKRLLKTLFLGVYKSDRPKAPGWLFRRATKSRTSPKNNTESGDQVFRESNAAINTPDDPQTDKPPAQRNANAESELYEEFSTELKGFIDSVTDDGYTTLIWAIREGRLEDIRALFQYGARLDAKDEANRTPLSWLGKASDFLDVEEEVEKRKAIAVELLGHLKHDRIYKSNIIDSKGGQYGKTPLIYAAKHGHDAIVRLLLQHNAEKEMKDSRRRTALSFAAQNGHTAVVRTLLDNGADISATDGDGKTPLHYAQSVEVVDSLIDLGADKNAPSSTGETPILAALRGRREADAEAIAEYLYKAGAKVHYKTTKGDTPLMIASERGYTSIVKDICRGADAIDFNAQDDRYGQTALAWACENGHLDVVTELVRHPEIDPNLSAFGYRGYTPLHFAVRSREKEILEVLLKELPAIDLTAKDYSGATPLAMAIELDEMGMVELLLSDSRVSQQSRDDLLQNAMSRYDESIIQTLLKAGASPLVQDTQGQNMLIISARRGQLEIFNKMLSIIQSEASWKESCVLMYHAAASHGHKSIIERLIELEIDPTQLDENMWSCLDCSEKSGFPEISQRIRAYVDFTRDLNTPYRVPSGLNRRFITENLDTRLLDIDSSSAFFDIRVVSEDSENGRLSVRTNYCIPADKEWYYYEIKILEAPKSEIIGIGLADDRATRYTMPGWYPGSWGYHGDDGRIFEQSGWGTIPNHDDYGDNGKYSKGDVVGCGINLNTGTAYTTLNGKRKGKCTAFSCLKGQLYPFIGMDITEEGVGAHIRVTLEENHDHPFVYQGPYD
ncbi:hypothetical protein AJ79_00936 [Helicocarpus griseus UAMH5409]|uniref:B30.2/SPRY domain-containing protein n=1 Tax=Helicocarpus griseus UAMH5409 TaxID=1447875 RepID=A0A2B7Y969_9EURO|nr:hypothetical protein AJ79_00936 [Helicocarpus griseus UAMH5409]